MESVIARLFSDSQDRTMTRRPLDLNEGAFRRFRICGDLITRAASSEVRFRNVVAAPAPARPGFTPTLKSQRYHAMQVRSKPQ